jgi:hypothetical protein
MISRNLLKIFGVVVMAGLALAACRAEEQGRLTRYKPGVYLGQKDAQLTKAQEEQLRERAAQQGGTTLSAGGGQ